MFHNHHSTEGRNINRSSIPLSDMHRSRQPLPNNSNRCPVPPPRYCKRVVSEQVRDPRWNAMAQPVHEKPPPHIRWSPQYGQSPVPPIGHHERHRTKCDRHFEDCDRLHCPNLKATPTSMYSSFSGGLINGSRGFGWHTDRLRIRDSRDGDGGRGFSGGLDLRNSRGFNNMLREFSKFRRAPNGIYKVKSAAKRHTIRCSNRRRIRKLRGLQVTAFAEMVYEIINTYPIRNLRVSSLEYFFKAMKCWGTTNIQTWFDEYREQTERILKVWKFDEGDIWKTCEAMNP